MFYSYLKLFQIDTLQQLLNRSSSVITGYLSRIELFVGLIFIFYEDFTDTSPSLLRNSGINLSDYDYWPIALCIRFHFEFPGIVLIEDLVLRCRKDFIFKKESVGKSITLMDFIVILDVYKRAFEDRVLFFYSRFVCNDYPVELSLGTAVKSFYPDFPVDIRCNRSVGSLHLVTLLDFETELLRVYLVLRLVHRHTWKEVGILRVGNYIQPFDYPLRSIIDDVLEILRRNVQKRRKNTGCTLQVPNMCHRSGQLNVAHSSSACFFRFDSDAAAFTYGTLVLLTLVLATCALVVFRRSKDLLAEKPVPLRFEGTIVYRLGFLHFPA